MGIIMNNVPSQNSGEKQPLHPFHPEIGSSSLLHQKPRYFEACLAGVSPASWTPLIRGIEVEPTQLQPRLKQGCM